MGSEDVSDLGRRAALAELITDRLAMSPYVVEVQPFGSLAGEESDQYSDIDLVVIVDGVSDRSFAEGLPDLLRPIGSQLIAGWGLDRLPETYVRTIYFEDYPLFWHVDLGCVSTTHDPGDDLARDYHWPQVFKMWIAAVKQYVRGRADGAAFLRHISKWADLSDLSGQAAARLGQSLDLCAARARSRGAPCDEVYRRCLELRASYLTF
jgi:hypothetical protein